MQINGAGPRADINQLLDQMRTMREAAQGQAMDQMRATMPGVPAGAAQPVADAGKVASTTKVQGATDVARPSFGDTLGNLLNQVNETQMAAGAAQTAFVKGERTDLVNVMVAAQKASVSFQAVTQVRNRLVEAYKDVMNMPI